MEITKTILWVEDFDSKDTAVPDDDLDAEAEPQNAAAHTSEILRVFPEEHCIRVDLQDTVDGALNKIDAHWGDYDCVVLDINLANGWPIDEETQGRVKEKLSNVGVKIPDKIEDFKTNTGYFIYLYLLCKGFPKDRVIMRTAYNGAGSDNLTKAWDTAFKQAGLEPPVNVGKADKNKSFHDAIDALYSDKNRYFLIRRLILDATNHWLDVLNGENCDVNNFVFNAAAAEEKRLSNESLRMLVSEINAVFPLRYDGNIVDAFSNALRKLSVPFEAYADYKKVRENGNAFTYLSIMRLMRNWYAHNLFAQNEPNETDLFFLIIIAFRALFDSKSDSMCVLDYEKAILKYVNHKPDLPSMPATEKIEALVYGFFRDTYRAISKAETLDAKYKSFSSEYWRMLDSLGQNRQDHSECTHKKLVELIWTSKCPIKLNFIKETPTIKQTSCFPDSAIVYFNYLPCNNSGTDILDAIIRVDCENEHH